MADKAKSKDRTKGDQEERPPGSCFIVGAPIGEIEDLSRRGVQALQSADLVVTSDEMYASSLMKRHAISKRLLPVAEGIEEDAIAMVLDHLDREKRVVLLTAPSFRIFSPLQRIIDGVRESGREPRVLPGVDMATMAIAMSGFPSEPYLVAGTLPIRRTQREEFIRRFEQFADTVVFYGGGNRLGEALETIAMVASDRLGALLLRPTVPGELIKRGTMEELALLYSDRRFHGEFCVILAPVFDDETLNDMRRASGNTTSMNVAPPTDQTDRVAMQADDGVVSSDDSGNGVQQKKSSESSESEESNRENEGI